jgi:hypothetical protein
LTKEPFTAEDEAVVEDQHREVRAQLVAAEAEKNVPKTFFGSHPTSSNLKHF